MEKYPKFLNKTGDVFVDFIIKQIIFHYNIIIFTISFIPSIIIFNSFCTDFELFFISLISSVFLLAVISLILGGSKFVSSDGTINGDSEYMKMYRKLNEIKDEK